MEFHEKLGCQTYVMYDNESKKYNPKLTSICLYLISSRKPNEEKLVGRVTVDWAHILNSGDFQKPELHKMEYCSAKDGQLNFSIQSIEVRKTDLKPSELDSDNFS